MKWEHDGALEFKEREPDMHAFNKAEVVQANMKLERVWFIMTARIWCVKKKCILYFCGGK